MKILLIEDDQKIASFIKTNLEDSGHTVVHESDGKLGSELALKNIFDVAIFDIMLPGMDGFTAIRTLRSQNVNFPILILSAKSALTDKVEGLSLGADDYLTKPFSFSELQARLDALVRRVNRAPLPIELKVANLKLCLKDQRVFRGDKEIILQPREFALLRYLVEHQGKIVSKKMIIEQVWYYNFDPNTNIVEVRICNLRDKIDKGFEPKLIQTIRGVGYVLKE